MNLVFKSYLSEIKKEKNIFPEFIFVAICLLFFITSCHHHKDISKKVEVKPAVSKTHIVAEKLNISEKEVRSKKLYSFISDWYGTPYKYGGCGKSGIDCSCFTGTLYLKVYGKTIGRNASLIHKECGKIKTSHLREGDFVFFKIGSRDVGHVGVYLKDNKFVHASTSRGVMISDLEEPYFKKHYYSAGRLKN